MKIILGSASKHRQRIFKEAGYDFEVMAADIDEKAIRHEDPRELTKALAYAKAQTLIPQIKELALLITVDQVISWNDKILEKPENAKEVREFLKGYAQYPPKPINSILVTNTGTGKQVGESDSNTVYFKPFPDEVIEQLIAEGNVFSQAGGFSIEDPLVKPYIERIEGSVDSVEGLPLELTKKLLQEAQA